jgi:predicted dinucleotide-binding enzyme
MLTALYGEPMVVRVDAAAFGDAILIAVPGVAVLDTVRDCGSRS